MEHKDLTIYYPLKCGGRYVPIAYSFLGTVSSFSDAKDSFDFIRKSFLTEDECQEECDALNKLPASLIKD